MATATSAYFPLATDIASGDGQDAAPGTVGSSGDSSAAYNAAGASGSSNDGFQISRGAVIAIIVVVVIVAIIGSESLTALRPVEQRQADRQAVTCTALFFVAKKREWKVRETLRRSARKVVTALTPRRTEFPMSVKDESPARSRGGNRSRRDDVPPTPRLKPEDLEKGMRATERPINFHRPGRR
jgi:hypothetical protein